MRSTLIQYDPMLTCKDSASKCSDTHVHGVGGSDVSLLRGDSSIHSLILCCFAQNRYLTSSHSFM